MIELSSGDEDQMENESDDGVGDIISGGTHINDLVNQPDELKRVQVNIGHDDDDPDIFLASQIATAVKPHQVLIYGIDYIWYCCSVCFFIFIAFFM